MSLATLMARVRTRALFEADLGSWWWTVRRVRGQQSPLLNKTVLFCDLMTMTATAKVEALFAAGFRQEGLRPLVLLRERAPLIERLFTATGETEFVYLDDLIDGAMEAEAQRKADALMAQTRKLDELVRLEIDGYRVGRNVQSLALRTFRRGRFDDANPEHRREVRRILGLSLAAKAAAEKLLGERTIDLAVFLERGYSPAGEFFDGCLLHGINTIQWLGAPQSGTLLFKRFTLETRAQHPFALSDDSWRAVQAMPWTDEDDARIMDTLASHYGSGAWYNRQQLQEGKIVKSADEIRAQLGLDPNKKTAVIFTHILYDATFFYGDSLFGDYEEWLVETVRAAIGNPNLNWVVKVHPVNVWRSKMDGVPMEQLEATALRQQFGDLPGHIALMSADTDINTYSLFQMANYGLTVRGTVGMELPCFGITTVTAGTGRYSGRGFTIDPPTVELYRATLARLHEVPRPDETTVRAARRYAYASFFLRPIPMSSFSLNYHANTFGFTGLTQNTSLPTSAVEDFSSQPDIKSVVRWARGRNLDLMTSDLGYSEPIVRDIKAPVPNNSGQLP